MFDRMLVNMVISFALRQIAQYQGAIDWRQVRADADARIRKLVPGEWFDDAAAAVVRTLLEGIELVLGEQAKLEALIRTLAAKDWSAAARALVQLLLEGWTPTDSASARATAALA